MTKPRSSLVSLSDTPWYHVVSRCVRRAFLCGQDSVSGKSYDHRRGWIEQRLRQLAQIFAIDVGAYAVMSNHYHIVLRIDEARAQSWSDTQVLQRWTQLFSGPELVRNFLNEATQMGAAEREKVAEIAAIYRQRLYDLSWFMRVLNENISRQANAEDGVKGHFWEGRFKSQALLDEPALMAAMAYVDLNPVRAGMAFTPEESEFTSIRQRLIDAGNLKSPLEPVQNACPMAPLLPFEATGQLETAIPFAFEDYLELIDSVGRAVHPHKRGYIAERTPKILDRLGVDMDSFMHYACSMLKEFGSAVGAPKKLMCLAASRQTKYLRGICAARRIFERNINSSPTM